MLIVNFVQLLFQSSICGIILLFLKNCVKRLVSIALLFSRRICCILSVAFSPHLARAPVAEKAVNKIVVGVIAAGLAVFAILQIVEMVRARARKLICRKMPLFLSIFSMNCAICFPELLSTLGNDEITYSCILHFSFHLIRYWSLNSLYLLTAPPPFFHPASPLCLHPLRSFLPVVPPICHYFSSSLSTTAHPPGQFISYANPVVSSVTVYNTSFVLPGVLICMPAPADISAPVANTIYADPRLR